MGSYTLHITQTVITIALLYIPVLVAAVVQVKLAGKHKRSWKQDVYKRQVPRAVLHSEIWRITDLPLSISL